MKKFLMLLRQHITEVFFPLWISFAKHYMVEEGKYSKCGHGVFMSNELLSICFEKIRIVLHLSICD